MAKRNLNNDRDKSKRQSIQDILRQINNPDKPCGACKTPEPHPDFTFPDSAPDDVRTIIAHMRTERTEQAADEVITIPLEKYDNLIASHAVMSSIRALCKRQDIGRYHFPSIVQALCGVDESAPPTAPTPAPGDTDADDTDAESA